MSARERLPNLTLPTDIGNEERFLSHRQKMIEERLIKCYAEEIASVINQLVVENCNGCIIDHPSQRQHPCLMMESGGFSEIDAKKQAFSEILPDLRKKLGNIYLDRLKWMTQMKRDPVHRKIIKTKDAFVDEDDFDPDEASTAAIKKRKFLLERLLEDRQNFPDGNEDDDDDDNVSTPYELKSELNYYQ